VRRAYRAEGSAVGMFRFADHGRKAADGVRQIAVVPAVDHAFGRGKQFGSEHAKPVILAPLGRERVMSAGRTNLDLRDGVAKLAFVKHLEAGRIVFDQPSRFGERLIGACGPELADAPLDGVAEIDVELRRPIFLEWKKSTPPARAGGAVRRRLPSADSL
jgi:hypothetical protein